MAKESGDAIQRGKAKRSRVSRYVVAQFEFIGPCVFKDFAGCGVLAAARERVASV